MRRSSADHGHRSHNVRRQRHGASARVGCGRRTQGHRRRHNLAAHEHVAAGSASEQPGAGGSCPGSYLTPSPANLERVRQATLCLINSEREAHGESALKFNYRLAQAAKGHTEEMVTEGYFEHVSPSGSTPLTRIKASGYIPNSRVGYALGENLAWGTLQLATPKAIVDSWIASPGHLANILNPLFRETAIAVLAAVPIVTVQPGATYTEDFGAILG